MEIKSLFGVVLYSHECEDNTIKKTVEEAVKDGVNLSDATLSGICLPIHCKWWHSVIDGKIEIGCKRKSIEDWDLFFNSDEEYRTKRGTADFKQIQAVFESYKAYLNFLKSN